MDQSDYALIFELFKYKEHDTHLIPLRNSIKKSNKYYRRNLTLTICIILQQRDSDKARNHIYCDDLPLKDVFSFFTTPDGEISAYFYLHRYLYP
jgi:hypothetical protein